MAVLLAAGASSRFGLANKLLVHVGGEPLIARVAGALLGSRVSEVIVVTPADQVPIATALDNPIGVSAGRCRLVANPEPWRGIGSSIAAGIGAVPRAASSAMIVPGDMPGLTASVCDLLIDVFGRSGGGAIVHAATLDGGQRNPVIWPKRLFADLLALEGDTGGKQVIARERTANPAAVIAVQFAAPGLFLDVDRPDDLQPWT